MNTRIASVFAFAAIMYVRNSASAQSAQPVACCASWDPTGPYASCIVQAPPCPAGVTIPIVPMGGPCTQSCLVTENLECCAWDCSGMAMCFSGLNWSCCNGYCGEICTTNCGTAEAGAVCPEMCSTNAICAGIAPPNTPMVETCCYGNQIQHAALRPGEPTEWTVNFGDIVPASPEPSPEPMPEAGPIDLDAEDDSALGEGTASPSNSGPQSLPTPHTQLPNCNMIGAAGDERWTIYSMGAIGGLLLTRRRFRD